MARLDDGVSLPEAQAAANLVYAQLLQEDWAHIEGGSETFKTRFFKKRSRSCQGGGGRRACATSRGRRSWC